MGGWEGGCERRDCLRERGKRSLRESAQAKERPFEAGMEAGTQWREGSGRDGERVRDRDVRERVGARQGERTSRKSPQQSDPRWQCR